MNCDDVGTDPGGEQGSLESGRRRTVVARAIAFVVSLFAAGCLCSEFWEIDKCLDHGGKWDYNNNVCLNEETTSSTLRFVPEPKSEAGSKTVAEANWKTEFISFADTPVDILPCELSSDDEARIDACAGIFRSATGENGPDEFLDKDKKISLATEFIDYLQKDLPRMLQPAKIDDGSLLLFNVLSKDRSPWFGDGEYEVTFGDLRVKSWAGSESAVKPLLDKGIASIPRLTVFENSVRINETQIVHILAPNPNKGWVGDRSSSGGEWNFWEVTSHWGAAPTFTVIHVDGPSRPERTIRVFTSGRLGNATKCCLLENKWSQNCACHQTRRGRGYGK